MDKHMPFVTVDLWTLIFTWINLLILFFIVKRFFFAPVSNVLELRKKEVENIYDNANKAEKIAKEHEKMYKEKLENAFAEANEIVNNAVKTAAKQADNIVLKAQNSAKEIIKQAEYAAEEEKREVFRHAKSEVALMAILIAEKILKKEMVAIDHKNYFNDVIDKLGDDE